VYPAVILLLLPHDRAQSSPAFLALPLNEPSSSSPFYPHPSLLPRPICPCSLPHRHHACMRSLSTISSSLVLHSFQALPCLLSVPSLPQCRGQTRGRHFCAVSRGIAKAASDLPRQCLLHRRRLMRILYSLVLRRLRGALVSAICYLVHIFNKPVIVVQIKHRGPRAHILELH
jgi:hypothetical protein